MLQILVDEEEIRRLYMAKINRKVEEIDAEKVYWDSNELKRRTCMSWNTIQDNFFHDKDFPKAKIGGKWYYPADETKLFLQNWISERRCT